MPIIFKNKGEIDPVAITTFGISVKDDSAIGYFGTGLKMAISVILRSGGSITIYSGENEYSFTTKSISVKGKDFNIVCMNEKELGFTTDNAKNWEMWQAVREILCNCIDEHGDHYVIDNLSDIKGSEGTTTIIVKSLEFEKSYRGRSDFILSKTDPIYENDYLSVYRGSTKSLFYKNVRVYESERPFKYTYNFKSHISLTEDRTMSSSWYDTNYTLCRIIIESDSNELINGILDCGKLYVEYYLEWSSGEPSQQFKDKLYSLRGKLDSKAPPILLGKYKPSLREELRLMPTISLTTIQQKMMDKAISMLSGVGVFVNTYPIRVMPNLGEGVLGLADPDNHMIYLSERVFDLGTKYLAGTIYEEYIHIAFGVKDETRAFQDVVIQHLMSTIEQIKDDAF